MATQKALDKAYMTCAFAMAELSHATRAKVGAILVSAEGGIIAEGVNGTPCGFPNPCEDAYELHRLERIYNAAHQYIHVSCSRCHDQWPAACLPLGSDEQPYETFGDCKVTRTEVLHAESNAIMKVARSTNKSVGSTLYITMSPCPDCSKLIIQAGIVRVVYAEKYRMTDGFSLLEQAGITVEEYQHD